jgi:hypothetical protein
LETDPAGTLAGSTSGDTSAGVASFSNLKITSVGSFRIKASGSDMTSGYSSYFSIVNLALTSIQVSSSVSQISAYFDFTITALLKDQELNTWTSTTSLSLTGSLSISGDTSLSTSSGSALFSIYSSQSGTLVITVSSSGVSGSTTITILKNSLKIYSITPTVIEI